MSDLKLLILGPVRLKTNNGKCIERLGTKAKALLAYLATQPDGRAEREVLANLLWDFRPQAEARHCLRQALLTLRTQLGSRAEIMLKSDRESLQLRLDAIDVDLRRFEQAFRSTDEKTLMAAAHLWRSSFCEGLDVGAEPFEDWLLRERARLDDLASVGFRCITKFQASAGCFVAAVEAARHCVALNPFDDSAHANLIDLYGRLGWIGSARKAYLSCTELFQRELDEEPNEAVQAAITRAVEYRALERRDHHIDHRPAQRFRGAGLPTAPISGIPSENTARTLKASGMTLYLVAAFSVMTAISVIVSNELNVPTTIRSTTSVAWVGSVSAVTYPRAQTVGLPDSSAVPSQVANRQQITIKEAISRALQMDPAYAYLLPAGC